MAPGGWAGVVTGETPPVRQTAQPPGGTDFRSSEEQQQDRGREQLPVTHYPGPFWPSLLCSRHVSGHLPEGRQQTGLQGPPQHAHPVLDQPPRSCAQADTLGPK